MKEVRKFFVTKIAILFFLIVVSSIWKIAEPWKIYLWIFLLVFLPMAIFPVLGKPLYSLWQIYLNHTSEGMRFFQGIGILLLLLAFYILKYHFLLEEGISIEEWSWEWSQKIMLQKKPSALPLSAPYFYLGLTGLFLLVLGSIPLLADFFFSLWMGLASVLQAISSRIILFLVYILGMLPAGLLAKLVGKKFLDKSFRDEKRESYWIEKKDEFNPRHYRRSF